MAQIVIADATPKVQYAIGGTPSTGPFAIPFPYFTNADIKVYFDAVLKTEITHYTISGTVVDDGFSGGNVTLGSSESNITVTIQRDIPVARTTDFPVGPFNIATLNKDLDKLYAIGQQLESFPYFKLADSDATGASTTVPTPVANGVLSWNAAADALENSITTSSIAAAATNAANAATSATAAASSATTSAASAVTSTNYATKVDGAVTGTDFSSKAWSVGGTNVTTTASRGAAKEWATTTGGAVDTSEFSAKEYAQGTAASTGGSSKSWAQDTDQVNGASTNDRSAKNWSQGASMTGATLGGSSKDWAQVTGGTVDGTNFSSKEWALGTTVGDGSAKDWAILAEDSAVTGSSYSSLHHAAKSAASAAAAASSATAAASGQLYSTVVNQTGASLSPSSSNDGTYYLCDTSSNTITVTLPAIGSSEGMKFAFQKTHASNNLVFARSGSDTLNGSASNITITDVDASIIFVADDNTPDNYVGTHLSQVVAGTGITKTGSVISLTAGGIALSHVAIAAKTECIAIAVSDETTALEAGVAKATFHMPYAFTLTGIKAGVTTAPVGSVLTVDVNEAGATILTTKLTIDAGEKTSSSAATAAVNGGAGPALAADALMTIDLDGVGSGTAGAGLKVYLIGYQT